MGKLSIIGMPIGNLGDITLRALEVLKGVDIIAAEDTRVTKKLLSHFDIHTDTIAYHAHSGEKGVEKVLELLRVGKWVGVVSDAGTPGISDPGSELVSRIRDELPEVVIDAVPGASALTSALSIAGVHTARFHFLGFLPHKKGRKTLFAEIANEEHTVVFYESPHRIMKTLDSLVEVLDATKQVVVLRELTKMHEEVVRGSAQEVCDHFVAHADTVRGEFVVVVASC